MKKRTVDLASPIRLGIGIVALISTFHTPIFWLALYLVLAGEIRLWAKFR